MGALARDYDKKPPPDSLVTMMAQLEKLGENEDGTLNFLHPCDYAAAKIMKTRCTMATC